MVAGPFIAQRAVNHDEVRRLPCRDNLTRRGEANQQLAPAGKQLLGDKNGEGRANGPAYDPDPVAAEVECVEFRVITGPTQRIALPPRSVATGAPSRRQGPECRPGAPPECRAPFVAVPRATELREQTLTAWTCSYCRGWVE